MTQDELTALLNAKLDSAYDASDVPDDTNARLAEIARWMHIDQPGFAKSGLKHMMLECSVLMYMLNRTRNALVDLADAAQDDSEAEGDAA
jgi:hypothetical protein